MEDRPSQIVTLLSETLSRADTAAFIVGVPRSGTTLLVELLGAHPQLAGILETRFVRNLLLHCEEASWYWGNSLSRRLLYYFAEPWARSWFAKRAAAYRKKVVAFDERNANDISSHGPWIPYTSVELMRETDRWLAMVSVGPQSEGEVYRLARHYVDTLFSIQCAKMNKPYWINKTPGLLTYLHYLPKLFPRAKFIHIIRDGRDVAASTIATTWGVKTVKKAARRWKTLLLTGRERINPTPTNYIELRYEELVGSPATVLGKLFAFLGFDADLNDLLSRVQVSRDRVGIWKTRFSGAERKIFNREAGDLLMELGYEKDSGWVD
ncbi:MAG: sulfotransferase [Deltaproteobacteria bacterium]|nr:sulfotransferase [Deltaproteobacteria bacterium]